MTKRKSPSNRQFISNRRIRRTLNDLAWMLATSKDSRVRDGRRAVAIATKACILSNWKNAFSIDTLAAASATAGNFADAVKYQQLAISRLGTGRPESPAAGYGATAPSIFKRPDVHRHLGEHPTSQSGALISITPLVEAIEYRWETSRKSLRDRSGPANLSARLRIAGCPDSPDQTGRQGGLGVDLEELLEFFAQIFPSWKFRDARLPAEMREICRVRDGRT